MFSNLLKAAVGLIVETPVALVADAATMAGALTDKKKPYTVETLEKVWDNLAQSTFPGK